MSKSPRWVILAHPWKLMLQIHSSPRETGWPKAVTRASRETSRGRDRLLKCSMRLHCMRRFRQMAGIRARLTELGCGHFWRWGTRTWRVPVYRLHDMMTQVIISVGKHDARISLNQAPPFHSFAFRPRRFCSDSTFKEGPPVCFVTQAAVCPPILLGEHTTRSGS